MNALEKRPHVRFDWSEQLLRQVKRWVNGRFWRYTAFDRYDSSAKTSRAPDVRQVALGLE